MQCFSAVHFPAHPNRLIEQVVSPYIPLLYCVALLLVYTLWSFVISRAAMSGFADNLQCHRYFSQLAGSGKTKHEEEHHG